ncbi:type II secretion system minor pseudopilin GspK [Vibrio sagamiensis]|uniref:Type II secretion system protein K n=1 Tax=Vibrio sagamiensis NBRC 104589 TaxID=1219064 RepID=A0A511QEZ0_9VIBR|nr:type II secretion system minor pseudopilin GspK [Vibrio sagamiensis]PNQ71281.1 general secretion pathway protein GspK [Vibrio agarivorans]GEM75863.1 type II secretion system protein K [Vibrio sagamiensis NBRC 104589]
MVKRQSGVALIVILMLLAIMTTIAASMTERLFLHFQRGSNQINYQQAYWYSLGVEELAKLGIQQSYKDSETINLSQAWAIKEQVYPLDYGQATGKIVDKQACFNLNVLATVPPAMGQTNRPYLVKVFQSLMEELEVEPYQAEVIADATWEYLDQDDVVRSMAGVEDSTYEGMKPAYLAANSWLADASELRSVYKVSGDIHQKLLPMICALPTDEWELNVNTLEVEQAPILVALFAPYLDSSDAVQLIEKRSFDGWGSVEDFLAESEFAGLNDEIKKKATGYLGVDSAFFELDAQVLVDESRVRIRSLLQSTDRDTVNVVRRRFGGISERVSDRSAE